MSKNTEPRQRRRTFLRTAGAAGLLGLAGCGGSDGNSGGDDGSGGDGGSSDGGSGGDGGSETTQASGGGSGTTNLVLTTSSSPTSLFAASQGIGSVVNQNTDEVFLDVRPSEGISANMGILNRGEADAGIISGFLVPPVLNREPPFDDLNFTLTQVMHIHNTDWFMVSANDGWESWADFDSNSRISAAPSGTSVRTMMDYALQTKLNKEYRSISVGFGDQGSALNSGRLDAGIAAFTNPGADALVPSWVQQMQSTADLRALDIDDESLSVLEEDSRMNVQPVEMGQFDGFAYTPETLNMLRLVSYMIAPAETAEDPIYNWLNTMWENREGMGDYHQLLSYHENSGDWWVSDAYEDVPFHPGAERFYKENDLWQDSFTSL